MNWPFLVVFVLCCESRKNIRRNENLLYLLVLWNRKIPSTTPPVTAKDKWKIIEPTRARPKKKKNKKCERRWKYTWKKWFNLDDRETKQNFPFVNCLVRLLNKALNEIDVGMTSKMSIWCEYDRLSKLRFQFVFSSLFQDGRTLMQTP